MAGLNSQIHLFLETKEAEKLNKEASELKISRSELIRRKLLSKAIPEEIILLRRLRGLITKWVKWNSSIDIRLIQNIIY